jgi:uncharacterized 2Fe-2S/4Fe-4S cluster protein (DUF4445 family)
MTKDVTLRTMTQRPANQTDDREETSNANSPPVLKVKIVPQNLEVGVQPGEILLDVLRRAGASIEAECGTQGTCGRCMVQILSGQCQWPGPPVLAAEKIQQGFVLSCQARVTENLLVRIPEMAPDAPPPNSTPCLVPDLKLALRSELSPLTEKVVLDVPPVSPGGNGSDLERLRGCLAQEGEMHFGLSVLRTLPQALRQNQGQITVTKVKEERRPSLVKLEPGSQVARHFGVACDIGTTTVALQLVDLARGRVIDTVADYNGQIECGADVISRILYAQKDGRLEDLRLRIVNTINGLLDVVLRRHGLAPDEVTGAVFAGNTTMTHLVLGINPQYLREDPYVPALKTVPLLSAGALDIHLWPEAPILFAPCVGSYVGGDITAGVLCAQLQQNRGGITLFIDIGTNGELVLSGDDWMISCACSAGPAFEGVGISCGMRAAPGAIEAVEVPPAGADIACRVIGGQAPQGICGSGLIELVAGLFIHGVIGRDGRFNEAQAHHRVRLNDNPRTFVVVEAAHSATGQAICLSERDIANLMRAKAAIYSAGTLFLKKLGLAFGDIDRVYVAGGFGCHLDVQKAIALGLFPDIDPSRFSYLGNTSLQGACLALLSREHRRHLAEVAQKMTYIDLSNEREYLDEYAGALFLPHTHAALFPNVMKRLSRPSAP